MDHASFDRIAKLLGGATTRRRGLASALGAALGLASATATVAEAGARSAPDRKRVAKPEGPCGNGSRKDNLCTKDKQCCTGYCQKGLKNKDGKGRCRCIRKGQPCKPSQTCCHGGCNNGICGKAKAKSIATGKACDPDTDTCQDSNASCIPYYQSDPGGAYCLLPNGASCSAATDCGSKDCASGVCAAETCTVCANGCPYSTVQAAINDAAGGAVIRIDAGTYTEDLTTPNMDLTLTNCNGAAVTLVNVADNTRTLILGTLSDTAPHKTVTVRNLTISGKGTAVASDPAPVAPAVGDGGIMAYTNLILDGTAKVTGCNGADSYGGVHSKSLDEKITITLRGFTEISNNYGKFAAGISVYPYTDATLIIEGNAQVTGNYASQQGGGIYGGSGSIIIMRNNAKVSHNRSANDGGGIYIYGSGLSTGLIMSDNAEVRFNTSETGNGGGLYIYSANSSPYTVELHGSAQIADNSSSIANSQSGGGVEATYDDVAILMDGNAAITRNTAGGPGGGASYVALDIKENASITGNTPDNCALVNFKPGSKQCGV